MPSRRQFLFVLGSAVVLGPVVAWLAGPSNSAEQMAGKTFPVQKTDEEWRRQLSADANNLGLAAHYARRCIERSRKEADPRCLGRAQAALAPWWNTTNAPAEALVLRATIRQSQHDFTNALADLEFALKQAPRNAQGWLTRATILTVLGEYPTARRACIPLAQLAPGLVALTAGAVVSAAVLKLHT